MKTNGSSSQKTVDESEDDTAEGDYRMEFLKAYVSAIKKDIRDEADLFGHTCRGQIDIIKKGTGKK